MKLNGYSYDERVTVMEEDLFMYTGRSFDNVYSSCSVRKQMHMTSEHNYFECKIVSKGEKCSISIGLGPNDCKLDKLPGSFQDTIGYKVNTGEIYQSRVFYAYFDDVKRIPNCLTCTENDRIGCGIDFNNERDPDKISIFFTRNGQQVRNPIKCRKPSFRLYPLVGMCSEGEKVQFLRHCHRPSLLAVSVTIYDTQLYGML